jgi:hypothetical protein
MSDKNEMRVANVVSNANVTVLVAGFALAAGGAALSFVCNEGGLVLCAGMALVADSLGGTHEHFDELQNQGIHLTPGP